MWTIDKKKQRGKKLSISMGNVLAVAILTALIHYDLLSGECKNVTGLLKIGNIDK